MTTIQKSTCYRRAFTEVIASVVLSGNSRDNMEDEIVETLVTLFRDYDKAREEEAALRRSTEEGRA